MSFDQAAPHLRVVSRVNGRAGVVTRVEREAPWGFGVLFDGDDEELSFAADKAELFTAALEPGDPRRPYTPS